MSEASAHLRVPLLLGIFALSILAGSTRPALAAMEEERTCSDDVCIQMLRNQHEVIFEGSSIVKVPVAIRIEFETLRNLVADEGLPIDDMIPPGARVHLLRLVRQDVEKDTPYPFVSYTSDGDHYPVRVYEVTEGAPADAPPARSG